MRTRLTRSLSVRLLLIFLLLGVLFAYGAQLAVRWVYATDQLRDLVSGHLSLHVQYVRQDLGSPPSIDRALAMTGQVPIDISLTGPDLDWASHPDFPPIDRLQFGNARAFSAEVQTWLTDLQDVEFAALAGRGYLRMANGPYTILVATPALDQPVEERQLVPIIIGIGLGLVLLAYLAVRWLFKPLDRIREGAASIAAGQLEHRIEGIRHDELGDLASEINTMADQVQRMLDAKRQLLLGISHELRTPLSRSKLALELADGDAGLDGIRQDLREMETIITALLEAERLNDAHRSLARSSFKLAELVDNMVSDYFARNADHIELEIDRELIVVADRARLTLMLKNLISNALRYGEPDHGPVSLQAHRLNDALVLAVQDHGPGLDPAQAGALGEPFFRSDGSRTRGTGGTGLGLYLARLVAEAHGGTLTLDPAWTQGARLVASIPLSSPRDPG